MTAIPMKRARETLTYAGYQHYKDRFGVSQDLMRHSLSACEPFAIEALSIYAQRHLWQDELPYFSVMTTPVENGGWGRLLPMWFKPHERPVPFYSLDNWALFALFYARSFGPSPEAGGLMESFFQVESLVQVVAGSNLLLPFLPSTQGTGVFFRHGMLPYLLSILWLDKDHTEAWLRLHELGAEGFIASQTLQDDDDPVERLKEMEFQVFGRIERNNIESEQAVDRFLLEASTDKDDSLSSFYQLLFGAINLGVTALAQEYASKPLRDWRSWIYQELSFPYRLPEYGAQAIRNLLARAN